MRRRVPGSVAVALFAILLLPILPMRWLSMPGTSHRGPLPAATDEERAIEAALRRHVEALAGRIGERNVFRPAALEESARYLEAELRALGHEPVAQPFTALGVPVRNVEIALPGTDPSLPALVVGGHYDSVRGCPGANDNGSGAAAVLELARLLPAKQLPRTVRLVLFVNEEPPFFEGEGWGALAWARAAKARGDALHGMISVETIGSYGDAPGSQRYPFPIGLLYPDRGDFLGFVGDTSSASLVRAAIGSFRRHTAFPSEGIAGPRALAGIGWSDHAAFWKIGVPALMVTDTAPFRYAHYHTEDDTPEKLDYGRTARVVAGLARVVRELAGAPAPGSR